MRYQCTICHGIYESDWTDEEALAEAKQKFGMSNPADLAVVCDDCYKGVKVAVLVLVGTLKSNDDSEVVLELADGEGAIVGELSMDRESWDETVETIVVDGVADVELD